MGRTKTKTAEQPTLIVHEGKTDVAVQKNAPPPALAQADPLLSLIERASKDPTIDIDKMERLIKMHDGVRAQNAQMEYDSAMALAQAEMKTIKTNKSNSHTSSKYADYEAMDKAIRPIYTKHGFAMSFNTGDAPKADEVRVLLTISHRSGHRQEYKMDIPADGKGPKGDNVMTKTHAASSAVSYGKRIIAGMAWNLSVGNDDDGNDAASIAERAQTMADSAIQFLNTANLDTAGLEKYRTEKKTPIAWLKKNSPEQFERFQTAFSNAAEAAGIPKKEPTRGGDSNKASTAASPHGAPKKDGQPVKPSPPTGAGGDSKSEAASKPALTDVEDLNEKQPETVFEIFKTAREFFDFSDHWLQDPKRTPAEAKKWEEFYREKIKEMANHQYERIRTAIADTIGLYSAVLAKETAQ